MERSMKLVILIAVLLNLGLFTTNSDEAAASNLERDVIKIGIVNALKRPYGIASIQGAEIAAKELNNAGGVLGAKIQLLSADSEMTAPKATEAIEKLFYSDKVDVIVGAYSSEEATAFQMESAKLKINIILHGTTSIMDQKYKADPEKYKYYWNSFVSDLQIINYTLAYQLEMLIGALKKELGLKKINVAVVSDVALWTEIVHAKFVEAIKGRSDCELVYTGKIARDAVDFTGELTEMRAKNTQLLLTAMGYSAGYTFVKQAYDIKLPALMTGTNALTFSVNDFLKAVGVEAAAYITPVAMFSMPTTPHTAKLIKDYEKIHGTGPQQDVGITYNAVKAYAKAVEIAQSLDHAKVQQALKKVKLPESQAWNAKEFWFEDNHRAHVSQADGIIFSTFQFTPSGTVNILDPPEYKTGDLLIPPWMIKHWKKN